MPHHERVSGVLGSRHLGLGYYLTAVRVGPTSRVPMTNSPGSDNPSMEGIVSSNIGDSVAAYDLPQS